MHQKRRQFLRLEVRNDILIVLIRLTISSHTVLYREAFTSPLTLNISNYQSISIGYHIQLSPPNQAVRLSSIFFSSLLCPINRSVSLLTLMPHSSLWPGEFVTSRFAKFKPGLGV